MKKVFLAVMFTTVVSGAAFAGGSAMAGLNSNAQLSADGISFKIPRAVMSVAVVPGSDTKAYDNVLGPLNAAVIEAQRDELQSYGYYFALEAYPAKTKLTKIFADVMNVSESDMGDYAGYFKMSSGTPAIRAFAKDLRAEVAEEESAVIIKSVKGVATATEKAFLGANRFVKVQVASHDRQEDGDFDYRVLIAQEKDGVLRVLSYIRNPY